MNRSSKKSKIPQSTVRPRTFDRIQKRFVVMVIKLLVSFPDFSPIQKHVNQTLPSYSWNNSWNFSCSRNNSKLGELLRRKDKFLATLQLSLVPWKLFMLRKQVLESFHYFNYLDTGKLLQIGLKISLQCQTPEAYCALLFWDPKEVAFLSWVSSSAIQCISRAERLPKNTA